MFNLVRRDWVIVFSFLTVVFGFAIFKYFAEYKPLIENNKWTSGVIYKKIKSAQSSRRVYYRYKVNNQIYKSSMSTLIYDTVILDSLKYIVVYNPKNPIQSKIFVDLPPLDVELGADLDSMKSSYQRNFSIWTDY